VTPSHFLSAPECSRKLAHTRTFVLNAYEREDGLLDLEALIEDNKPEMFLTQARKFDCGVPIHLMAIRITVNEKMDVVTAEASMQRMPFPAVCPEAQPSVQKLVGTNLLKGFRQEVASRIPASDRCSHLSELATLLPTLAIQTLMKKMSLEESRGSALHSKPLKIDGCLAWRNDGPLVLKYYPQWHLQASNK